MNEEEFTPKWMQFALDYPGKFIALLIICQWALIIVGIYI